MSVDRRSATSAIVDRPIVVDRRVGSLSRGQPADLSEHDLLNLFCAGHPRFHYCLAQRQAVQAVGNAAQKISDLGQAGFEFDVTHIPPSKQDACPQKTGAERHVCTQGF